MSDDSYHEKNYNDIEKSANGLKTNWRYVFKQTHNIKQKNKIKSRAANAKHELSDKREYKKSTTNRRADFEYLELEKVNFTKSMMMIVYILVVVGLAYTLFLSTDIDKRTKGLILAFFTLYPVLFIPIILYFYNTIVYVLSLMTGNIYKKTDF